MASSDQASQIRDLLQCELKIFVKDIRDRQAKKRPLTVRTWSTIKDVKDQIQQLLHVPPCRQRLYSGPLIVSAKELPNYRTLYDAGVYRSGDTILLDIVGNTIDEQASLTSLSSSAVSDICVSSSMLDLTPRPMRRLVQHARRGLALGIKPELVLEGSGGTYFLHDTRKNKVAVFKPADEEPYAENNPRGYVNSCDMEGGSETMSLREGIRPGESCLREVAAYLLDHGGFSSVPMTTLTDARHPAFNTNGAMMKTAAGGAAMGAHSLMSANATAKTSKKVGSCQEFVNAECSMDDLSPSKIDVDEVHKIAILDIRIMNADRNAANLLCRRREDNSLELVPIDHGFCLRAAADVAWFDWCWLDWPQLKKPLSKKSKEYILNLDIEADVRLLEDTLRIGRESLDYFRASCKLLQAGVKAGLTLYDIAVICSRQDSAGLNPSPLEKMYTQAKELSSSATENGRWHHTAASRALVNQLAVSATPPSISSNTSVHRSQSTVNFGSIFFPTSSGNDSITPAPPAIMSGSDSSSDVGDVELILEDLEENCDEWAASILKNVRVQTDHRERSQSFNSESTESTSDILSSGHLGFWVVRPGSDDDDDTWDDVSSSEDEMTSLPSSALSRRMSSLTLNSHRDSNETANSTQSKVEFDLSPLDEIPLVPPPKKIEKGMVRSQSYSAFSFPKGDALSSQNSRSSLRRNDNSAESQQCRAYFYKFIDLLIEKETVQRKHQTL
jgi:hypothetical protein